MRKLPKRISTKVLRLFNEGEAFADEAQDKEALDRFQAAWDLLPEPKGEWEYALAILSAIADSHFHLGDYQECYRGMQQTLRCGGDVDNPFIQLRLGQCLFELGDLGESRNWMVPVYLMEGNEIFESEDPKYLAFVKERLSPPPGGWPVGWK